MKLSKLFSAFHNGALSLKHLRFQSPIVFGVNASDNAFMNGDPALSHKGEAVGSPCLPNPKGSDELGRLGCIKEEKAAGMLCGEFVYWVDAVNNLRRIRLGEYLPRQTQPETGAILKIGEHYILQAA